AVRPADLDLVGGRGARGADRRRARSRAGRIEDLGGPDLLARAAAAVGPGGPEGPGDPGQAVVVAELVAVVLPAGRLVGLRRGDLHRGREGDAVVEGGLVVDVDLLARGVGHRVVVHDADPAGRLVDHQPLVELVVQARLVVDHPLRLPGRAAVGRAGEPDADLAGRGGVRPRLVRRSGAVGPARDVVQRAAGVEGRATDVEGVEGRRHLDRRAPRGAAGRRFGDEDAGVAGRRPEAER